MLSYTSDIVNKIVLFAMGYDKCLYFFEKTYNSFYLRFFLLRSTKIVTKQQQKQTNNKEQVSVENKILQTAFIVP